MACVARRSAALCTIQTARSCCVQHACNIRLLALAGEYLAASSFNLHLTGSSYSCDTVRNESSLFPSTPPSSSSMRGCLGIGGRSTPSTTTTTTEAKERKDKKSGLNEVAPSPHVSVFGGSGVPLWNTPKRQAVAAESTVASHIPVIEKSFYTKQLIGDAIRDNLLCQDLPEAALQVIIGSMTSMNVKAGTEIIRQGDTNAHQFFVLEEGTCEVWVKDKLSGSYEMTQTYSPGSAFGELALLYAAPRAATVRASSPCRLWVMERAVYNAVKRNCTQELVQERHRLLEQVPGIKNLPAHHRALLVDALKQVEFGPGRVVFLKGSPGTEFYLIKEGSAQVQEGSKVLSVLERGHYFGERSLMGGEVRAADVVAATKLVCYCLTSRDFKELLGSADDFWRFEALQRAPILYNLTEQQLWQLASVLQRECIPKGQVVFEQGDPGEKFYIIEEGVFAIQANGKQLARIDTGSCFGELALLRQDRRAATVVAMSDAKVLTLSRDQFQSKLGDLSALRSMWRFEALRRVPLLCTLPPDLMSRLATALVSEQYTAGQDVILEGEKGDKFYIVEYGRLGVFKASSTTAGQPASQASQPNGVATEVSAAAHVTVGSNVGKAPGPADRPVQVLEAGNYFGELSLIRNEPRAATVRAMTNVSLLTVHRTHFSTIMGPLLEAMVKQAERYKAGTQGIDLRQIKVLSTLGTGGFGQVLLVQYGAKHFALKCIKKQFVLEHGLVEHIRREKEALMQCNSHFIVKLKGTAQDSNNIYLMMEAVMGGELFGYLQTCRQPLRESHARFYAASVILGLEYLHDRSHVYRDLKPENLLIDLQGYVKITDMGFVKRVEKGSKTYTLCGTPEYLAPEIIMNKGHNQAADWWALGILIFELCSGRPPFMHEDRLQMFRKICNPQSLVIPKHFGNSLGHLIKGLLEPNPAFRLGCGKMGAQEIKSHPWFANFDWAAFAARALPAPYIPQRPKHDGDAVNFSPHQAPLQVTLDKQTKDLGAFAEF